MADLITSARAKQSIPQSSFTGDEDTQIASLVSAVSAAARKLCSKQFDSQSYDELYRGSDLCTLVLNQCPLLSVSRVATAPTTVLTITNTGASNQRATAAVTATGLSLVRVASGVLST